MKKIVLLAMMLGLFSVDIMPSNSGDNGFTAAVLFGLVGANVYAYWTRASQQVINHEMKSTSVSCPNFSGLSESSVATSEDRANQTSSQAEEIKSFAQVSPLVQDRKNLPSLEDVLKKDHSSEPVVIPVQTPRSSQDARLDHSYERIEHGDVDELLVGAFKDARFSTYQSKAKNKKLDENK